MSREDARSWKRENRNLTAGNCRSSKRDIFPEMGQAFRRDQFLYQQKMLFDQVMRIIVSVSIGVRDRQERCAPA